MTFSDICVCDISNNSPFEEEIIIHRIKMSLVVQFKCLLWFRFENRYVNSFEFQL